MKESKTFIIRSYDEEFDFPGRVEAELKDLIDLHGINLCNDEIIITIQVVKQE